MIAWLPSGLPCGISCGVFGWLLGGGLSRWGTHVVAIAVFKAKLCHTAFPERIVLLFVVGIFRVGASIYVTREVPFTFLASGGCKCCWVVSWILRWIDRGLPAGLPGGDFGGMSTWMICRIRRWCLRWIWRITNILKHTFSIWMKDFEATMNLTGKFKHFRVAIFEGVVGALLSIEPPHATELAQSW